MHGMGASLIRTQQACDCVGKKAGPTRSKRRELCALGVREVKMAYHLIACSKEQTVHLLDDSSSLNSET